MKYAIQACNDKKMPLPKSNQLVFFFDFTKIEKNDIIRILI